MFVEVLELNQLKMKCFRCKQTILKKENYFEFNEFLDEEIVNVDYCHKHCWNEFKKGIGNVDEAMGMLRNLSGTLREKGLLPAQEVVVA